MIYFLLYTIAKRKNVRYKIHFVNLRFCVVKGNQQIVGSEDPITGIWSGMIGMVLNSVILFKNKQILILLICNITFSGHKNVV